MTRQISQDTESSVNQLTKAFQNCDIEAFRETLGYLIRCYGIQDLAIDAGFNRISLWRYMNGGQDIKLSSFFSILKVLGIKLQFEAEPQQDRLSHFLKLQRRGKGLQDRYAQFAKEVAEAEQEASRKAGDV